MKYYFLLFFITLIFKVSSQDIIEKTDGSSIISKIYEIGIDRIKYHNYNNLSGPVYVILKKDVSKITFENGEIEVFDLKKESEIEEIRNIIILNINKYGYQYEPTDRSYTASFIDDYLKIELMDGRTPKHTSDSMVLDFSKVYEFDGVSKRRKNLAFVNIWVNLATHKFNERWKKYKLVLRVEGHEQADIIMEALKEYNRLLVKQ